MLLVLFLNLLAVSPKLHEIFHADAGKVQHQCAVTLFAQGQVAAAAVGVAVPIPAVVIEFLPSVSISVSCIVAENLPPGRAPPLTSVNS